MPLSLQAKLLRAIQNREITRVGSTKARRLDIRFLSLTNSNLREKVAAGTFRSRPFLPAQRYSHSRSPRSRAGPRGYSRTGGTLLGNLPQEISAVHHAHAQVNGHSHTLSLARQCAGAGKTHWSIWRCAVPRAMWYRRALFWICCGRTL